MMKQILYSLTLGVVTLYIWCILYKAGYKEYDENFGLIIHAFLVSVAVHVIVATLWFRTNRVVREAKYQNLAFLLIASPATVIFVMMQYEAIFHVALRVN